MRLSPQTCRIICDTTRELAGPLAQVRVFGSRLDDAARGGDIDLLIELHQPIEAPEALALAITARLQLRLGDQPIDVLVADPATPNSPVLESARKTGRVLQPGQEFAQ